MEIEQIRGMVRTFGRRLDVPISRVDSDDTRHPSPRGVDARHGVRGAVLRIDPAFDELDDIEQEAVLAWTVMGLAVGLRSRRFAHWVLYALTSLVVLWPLDLLYTVAAEAGVWTADGPFDSAWLIPMGMVCILLTGSLIWMPLSSVWKRWMVYRTDREVVRTFGWDVMDALLTVDGRFITAAALETRMSRLQRLRTADGR